MELPNDFSPPNGIVVSEYSTVVNWFFEGVLYIYAKPEVRHSLADAKSQVALLHDVPDRVKIIIDIRKAPPLSVEARNYYSSEEGRANVEKTCLVIKSPVSKVIGNFYFGFLNKKIKTKMVNNPGNGLKWLNEL